MSLINKEIADFSAQAFIKAAGAEKGNFKTLAVKFTVSPVILILSTKHGMRIPLK